MHWDEVVEMVVAHCASAFPRRCSNCGRDFQDLRAYFQGTSCLGAPICYDQTPAADPLGTLSFVNCACGSTVTLECADRGSEEYVAFLAWLERESAHPGASKKAVLEALRKRIRAAVLVG